MLYLIGTAILSENIKSFDFLDTEEQPLDYPFKIKCTSCHEVSASAHKFNSQDEVDRNNISTVNFSMKCKFCGSTCSVSFEKTKEKLYNSVGGDITSEDEAVLEAKELVARQLKKRAENYPKLVAKTDKSANFAVFLKFDCRGCEVVEFVPDEDTIIEVSLYNGNVIENCLEDGELFDYDDKDEQEVSVTEVQWNIVKA
ncbi:hypothetical protein ACO0RG_000465 [Hanseniaspora osmophila]